MLRYHFLTIFLLFPACLVFLIPLTRIAWFWLRYAASVVAAILITVPVSMFVLSHPINTPVQDTYWILRPVLAMGLILLMVRICLRASWSGLIYISIWIYLLRELCYHFSLVASSYLVKNSWLFDDSTFGITLAIHLLVYISSYFLIVRNLFLDGTLTVSHEELKQAVRCTSLLSAVKPITVVYGNGTLVFNAFALFETIGSEMVMQFLYVLHTTERRVKLEKELAMQKRLWVEREKQMDSAKRSAELLNTKYHDMKHYIAALRLQKGSEGRERVLEDLENSIRSFGDNIHTGNETLDAVLLEKSLDCREKGILLTCVADGSLLRDMDAVDLYVMLGNALDNAIEAVMELEEEQRIISIAIFRVRNMIKIQIENPCLHTLALEDSLPVTTKEDRENHGFGLKSIRSVAERYGGYITTVLEDGTFTLHILLSIRG